MITLSTVLSRPNLAGLVSDQLRSWALPFRGCSHLRWNGIPAAPHRPGGFEPVRWFVQARQDGGFCHLSGLPRKSARRQTAGVTPYPGSRLSWVSPLWGLSFDRFGLLFSNPPPTGLSALRLPGGIETATRRVTTGRPSSSAEFAGQSRQTPGLATGGGPRNPCEVYAPFHDSDAEGCPNGLA